MKRSSKVYAHNEPFGLYIHSCSFVSIRLLISFFNYRLTHMYTNGPNIERLMCKLNELNLNLWELRASKVRFFSINEFFNIKM